MNTDLVQNLDFAPTFLDLANVKIPDDMQGQSLKPLFSGKHVADWRTAIYCHYYEYAAGTMSENITASAPGSLQIDPFFDAPDAGDLQSIK
ncbi:MAG: DUF4976 domain-containing protein [Calditrichia bacterium]